ncbi:hypothetical protein [Aliikangiella sp. G2MR2-5]|uniref:hypothetical protein n=1 Tax=Aliikangiella sp. G2MR2-5 TaxID=2788943 RepID=UPI0018AB23D7|nr:hypothetical protein [Aliikangiella sp. G2MR2-5]
MLGIFNREKQLLDEDIILWIFDSYAWAMEQFDKTVFLDEAVLVLPNNEYFPGKETSVEGMADLIFSQVKAYAGMEHWPTELVRLDETQCELPQQPPLIVSGKLRGKGAVAEFKSYSPQLPVVDESVHFSSMPVSSFPHPKMQQVSTESASAKAIIFAYHSQQLRSPEGIIAHFVHGLSHHLISAAGKLPPGGKDYLPMAGELIGIFMGFGVIFANSAIVPRSGGCGGCGGAQAPFRQVFMNEEESTYALALFCQLKGIDGKKAARHLKKHLRGFFKSALRDCKQRLEHYPQLKLV